MPEAAGTSRWVAGLAGTQRHGQGFRGKATIPGTSAQLQTSCAGRCKCIMRDAFGAAGRLHPVHAAVAGVEQQGGCQCSLATHTSGDLCPAVACAFCAWDFAFGRCVLTPVNAPVLPSRLCERWLILLRAMQVK